MSDLHKQNEKEPAEGSGHGSAANPDEAGCSSSSQQKTEPQNRYVNVKCTRSLLQKDVGSRRRLPFAMAEPEEKIIDFLDQNKDFLESYVMKNISANHLEGWLIKKTVKDNIEGSPDAAKACARYNEKEQMYRKQLFMEMVRKLQGLNSEHAVLWELARHISTSIGVDAYKVYKVFPDHPGFVQYFDAKKDITDPEFLARADNDLVKYVVLSAKSGNSFHLSRDDDPTNFPAIQSSSFIILGSRNVTGANQVLYQPILSASGKTVYVVEMVRVSQNFTEQDVDITSHLIVWASLLLRYCNLYMDKNRERNMSDFLLDVVKAIFEEMVTLDQLIKRILEFAQRLVNADRASLFLVDYRNFELVSTVFDLKYDPCQDRDMEKKEIRMPINRGIAGHVALSGETMNIPDAYSDYRFNRDVDEATGYKTVSILCMPVKVRGRVIGVVQMVNKRNHISFTHEDEVSFEIFASFFGLALHHARLYDKIIRKEQKYRVALEVLSYHNTCQEHEVKRLLTCHVPVNINLTDFYLDPYQFDDLDKCRIILYLFDDLFDLQKFDIVTVTRFILTVKKNYRTVPYHNFDHGWSVAHAMYMILKSDTRGRFDHKTRLALFVASLCHDLDHRGYTNKYMSETASPLAAMYSTSTLEHHHFNITVTILQQDGHNIFSHFSSDEYKVILRTIRQCILATDLAVYFPNLAKLNDIYEGRSKYAKFNWANPAHRDLGMAIAMTAADLSASAKPWDIQIRTVKVIFEEFYDQGDKEREAGLIPIPMMDRDKPDQQPSTQVGFLSQICVPCYSALFKLLPNTKPMYIMALKNLNNWKAKAARIEMQLGSSNGLDEITDFELEDREIREKVMSLEQEEILPESEDEEYYEEEDGLADIEELEENDDGIEEIRGNLRLAWRYFSRNSFALNDDGSSNSSDLGEQGSFSKEDENLFGEEEIVVEPPNIVMNVILVKGNGENDEDAKE